MNPIFKTDTFLLREITADDLPHIYHGLSHPEVIPFYGVSFDSLEATREQMDWYAKPEQQWWAICSLDGDEFYGAAGLNDIDLQVGTAEIGLWLLPDYWGQGILKQALPFVADYGLSKLGLNRIEGFVDGGNTNCKRAMAKLDFIHEKTLENAEEKDGRMIDVEVYVKTRK
ncbi:GNAT family N-acetyltransferase [Gilvibacter sediminis]|uniref:GNAT family N-acetyltransferase n=1 Tax=Gilvibacter sediminis TaxID=379071 RepID=UPI002350C0D1|nr:GNAT family protein [Gilvibacter sediminis]MDC7998941.1 GNAT family protein [Gilvibacter sediminis]